ncbi:MAG: response regulator [Bdellovibrionales bacterium]|jgi:CheY-like chemotaxis protein|nr:response regulator [Bdellovibrionales bacterium]
MEKNILVVDDDAQMRMSLLHILRREGYQVQEAGNGQQAIDFIDAPDADYDLVLMDIIMPDKEGVETILYLRKRYPDLKIIAMSGGARLFDFDPLRLARDCGANFTLAKPFEPADLRAMLRLCLQGE